MLNRCCNLLTKPEVKARLDSDPEHFGPEIAGVLEPFLLSSRRETLAWARPGNDAGMLGELGKFKGERPSGNPVEQVELSNPGKFS